MCVKSRLKKDGHTFSFPFCLFIGVSSLGWLETEKERKRS